MPQIFNILDNVDRLLAEQPSAVACRELLALAATEKAAYNYIYKELSGPGWFQHLTELDAFSETEASKLNAQAQYLVKIADQLPREVLEVMLLLESNDAWLLRQFCEAAMKMPKEQCEAWAEHLAKRIPTDPANAVASFMYHLPDFIQHLIKLNSEQAFALTSVALDILKSRHDDESEKFSTRMDSYHYQELLKDVIPEIARLDACKAADLLGDKLDQAIRLRWSGMKQEGDASHAFWLPAVEDHPQNGDYYLEGSIAIALRKVLETDLGEDGDLCGWLQWLQKRSNLVYTRMSIHLVRLFGSPEQIEEWLLNKTLFDDSAVLHEYLLLLQYGFPRLNPDDQSQLLSWIEAIPEYGWVQEEYKEKHRRWQQYRRLAFIHEHLSGEWRRCYDALFAEMDEHDLDRLSFDRWTGGGFIEDRSPVPPEKIEQMSVKDLVEYLTSDILFDDFKGITERGLEKSLVAAVAKNPAKYAAALETLKNPKIKPLFVRGISTGLLKEALTPVSDGIQLEWVQWCMNLPPWEGDDDGQPHTRGHEDNKKEILRFLKNRMASKPENPLPLECRETVFEMIKAGLDNPDPTPDRHMSDPQTTAINSVRGSAMETAFSYGLWVLRGLGLDDPQSFEQLLELRQVLEAHLDVGHEPSPAIRSCYGLYIPQLCWMDKAWLSENLGKIFPEDTEFFAAAWNTYLLYSQCYRIVFDVLEPIYERVVMSDEILQCEKDDRNGKVRDANMRLCSHLVLFYAWEQIDLDEENMLCRFVRRAAPEYSTEVLRFMGRALCDEESLPEKVVDRFTRFHDWWVREVAPESPMGWKVFGEWFASPRLDREWKIGNLVKASVHTAFSYRSDAVLSELANSYFSDFPREVLAVTENYLGHQFKRDQRWALDTRDALPEILQAAHHGEDADIRRRGDALLGRLVSEGFFKYREIAEE